MNVPARTWTDEQRAIIVSNDPNKTVQARAGSGKTTMLVGYARARPTRRLLYIVFTAENRRQAVTRFPANTTVLTIHALARRVTGRPYAHKIGDVKPIAVAELYGCSHEVAADAITLMQTFLCSSAQQLADMANPRNRKQVVALPYAIRLWRDARDPANRDIPLSHDGYLKLFHLGGHKISGYDEILFDEAQDTNAVTEAILSNADLPLTAVGDDYQQIYGFRGAINSLSSFGGTRFSLTSSFRFGPEVARVANAVLHQFGETVLVRGAGGPSRVRMSGSPTSPHAYLSRTNAGVIGYAIDRPEARLYFVGGLETYRTERIRDAYYLSMRDRELIEDREIRRVRSFEALGEYAEEVNDAELKSIFQIVSQYRGRIPHLLADLASRSVGPSDPAAITLTTLHRSKGLEFDVVVVGETFDWANYLEACKKGQFARFKEELRLLYVGASRARRELYLNSALMAAVTEFLR